MSNQPEIRPLVNRFPAGRHAAVTWTIPDSYGGMTKALLHRSESFAKLGNTDVDVLTFEWRGSFDSVRERLRSKGALASGMRLLNFWEEVSWIDDDDLMRLARGNMAVGLNHNDLNIPEPNEPRCLSVKSWKHPRGDQSTVKCYFRDDGSPFLTVSDSIEAKGERNRSLRLYTRNGTVVGEWTNMRDLYFSWLDYWHAGDDAYMIIDSKVVAEFMIEYRRPNVATVYMVHGSHLQANDQTAYSALSKSRRKAFQNMHRFDAVCVLTDRQRRHVTTRLGDLGNIHVVPNGYTPPSREYGDVSRVSNRGVMLAILTKRKRVDHAIRALSMEPDQLPADVSLHVYGSGDQENYLSAMVDELGCGEVVSLDGFTDDPAYEFERSSFSLLTSSAEGFPLVLLEMMSAGCIPIAYDVNYGPSQIIEDGENGYLVGGENEHNLRDTIDRFLSLPSGEVEKMREAAVERAQEFSDQSVVELWKKVLRSATVRKLEAQETLQCKLNEPVISLLADGACKVTCEIELPTNSIRPGSDIASSLLMSMHLRSGGLFVRKNVTEFEWIDQKVTVSARFEAECFHTEVAEPIDFSVEVVSGDQLSKSRIPFGRRVHAPAIYGTIHGNLSARFN